jgi:hypothetical protein
MFCLSRILVRATDAELSRLLGACLSLESDYSGRNRALRKLTANALSIENLRHGFAFEEIGAGFNRTNLRRFLVECLEVASCASNLDIQLVAIRELPLSPSSGWWTSSYSASVVTAVFGIRRWFARLCL